MNSRTHPPDALEGLNLKPLKASADDQAFRRANACEGNVTRSNPGHRGLVIGLIALFCSYDHISIADTACSRLQLSEAVGLLMEQLQLG